MRPKLVDLYCGAGGAGRGYARAGFDVVGVDKKKMPDYPFEFVEADVLDLPDEFFAPFDAVHASPPCQKHTAMKSMHNAKDHLDLIPDTRALLLRLGLPYVIENVPDAGLISPLVLCGTMFDLGAAGAQLERHREFETSFPVPQPCCRHDPKADTIGLYGGHVRNRRRRAGSAARGVEDFSNEAGFRAMGIEPGSMTLTALCQAIPPEYTAYIGQFLMQRVDLIA